MGKAKEDGYVFGQALVLAMCLAVVVVASLMTPSNEMLTLFGQEIPVMCSWRRLFGVGCPGCGLTRSFVFMAHLQPVEAFHINYMGPFLFAGFFSQIPYRAWTIWRATANAASRLNEGGA